MIEIEVGIGTMQFTQEEIETVYFNHEFFYYGFLVLLNPEAAEKDWDIPYGKETVLEIAKEIYLKSGLSEKYLKPYFK